MPKDLEKVKVNLDVAGVLIDGLRVEGRLEPYYRRSVSKDPKKITINSLYQALREREPNASDDLVLRKTLVELGYRFEQMKEERQLLSQELSSLAGQVRETLAYCQQKEEERTSFCLDSMD